MLTFACVPGLKWDQIQKALRLSPVTYGMTDNLLNWLAFLYAANCNSFSQWHYIISVSVGIEYAVGVGFESYNSYSAFLDQLGLPVVNFL